MTRAAEYLYRVGAVGSEGERGGMRKSQKSEFLTARIIRLYRNMPGAPMPPKDDRGYLWGEVEGNEHWAFCAEIIAAIDASFDAGRGGAA